jgi:NAD/NADP transhydrogenase beta subunit
LAEFQRLSFQAQLPLPVTVTTLLSVLIGAVTFSGSMVAFGKLQGLMHGAPITSRLQKWLNIFLLLVVLVLMFLIIGSARAMLSLSFSLSFALIFGVALVIPVGGADMPVVISLLNSFSGWLPVQLDLWLATISSCLRVSRWCGGVNPDPDYVQSDEPQPGANLYSAPSDPG